MSSSQQLNRPADQNRAAYPTPDSYYSSQTNQAPPTQSGRGLSGGTDVMGEPVNPTSQSHLHGSPANTTAINSGSYPSSGSSYPYTTTTPAGLQQSKFSGAATNNSSAGTSPTGISPGQVPTHSSSYADGQQFGTTAAQTQNPSPYVQTTSIPGATGKTPMDSIMQVFNKWSKKAEDMTGNVWNHLRTGPNVADAALGRIAIGTKAMAEGGLENVFRQTFDVAPDERLLKSYACYLSTSTGPVAGTLYISSHKLAFCSDRPLAIPASPTSDKATTSPSSKPSATASNTNSNQSQQQWCYYKVTVPLSHLEAVNPSENTQKKPPEKYVQVKTVDGHEFWFMGFVHYDKGVKNLQEALSAKHVAPVNAAEHLS